MTTRYTETYNETKRPTSVRSVARTVALEGFSLLEKLRGDWLARPQVHLVYLHHVFSDEVAGFKDLLTLLQKAGMEFISHGDAVARLASGKIDKPYASFSFDDGLKTCVTAAEILEDFGTTGCFFVNGQVIDSDFAGAAAFCRDRINMPPSEFMSWNDLERLAGAGHDIGNHMFSHFNSAALSLDAFIEDFERNHDLLKARLEAPTHFAWPYGQAHQILPQQLAYVRSAGYTSASSAVRGCYMTENGTPQADPFYLLRDHCVAKWPRRHMAYLLARSARQSANAQPREGAPQ